MLNLLLIRSIGARIQALVGAGFLCGLAAVLAYQTHTRIHSTLSDLRDANIRIVQGISGPASAAIAQRDEAVIYSYMEVLASDPKAAGIVVTADQEAIKSQQSIDYFDLPLEKLTDLSLVAEKSDRLELQEAGDYQFIAVPVRDSAGRTIGSLGVAWSVKGLLNSLWRAAMIEALALVAVVAFVLLALFIAIRKFVTRPLTEIAGQIERSMEPGTDVEQTVNTSRYENRPDEIGSFARALNRFYKNAVEKNRLHAQLDSALANMSQGLCLFNKDRHLVVSNARYAVMYGLTPDALNPGMELREVLERRVKAGVYAGSDPQAYLEEHFAWASGDIAGSRAFELNNGRTVTVSHQPTPDGGWVATHTDITELRRIEKQLTHLAGHDALTDLPNRRRFREALDEALGQVHTGHDIAVLCLDLDRFKVVNDSFGHSAGDKLLKIVAARISGCVEQRDIVCRLGGDEFAILQFAAEQPSGASALAERISDALASPVDLGHHQVMIGASIGIAIFPRDGTEADKLLNCADMALYQAKGDGRSVHRFFKPEMGARLHQRQQIELELRTALEEGQFDLHYQPLVDLQLNQITCLEALLRWRHPKRGMVSPAEFIPVAEEAGLIVPMGEWVIRKACQEAAKWPSHVGVAVNISSIQFHRGDLPQIVFSALAASRISPSRLELEITESVLLQEDKATIAILYALRNFGVRIAMDDFGTGYSALGYLRKFPFDKIKIDRSFVSGLADSISNSAIINAVASMSRSLKISTVAEGVETETQRRLIQEAGITEMQGYLFSPPRTSEEIMRTFFGPANEASRRNSA